jgi:hypothetical protein
MMLPAIGSIAWYGLVPVGSPVGSISDKALWVFLINPVSMVFLAFLLMSLFFSAIDERRPHRPFKRFTHVLVLNYIAQARSVARPTRRIPKQHMNTAMKALGDACRLEIRDILPDGTVRMATQLREPELALSSPV